MVDENLPAYTRLARGRWGLVGLGTLWIARDHLLLVTNSFGVERYRRWFFKDIQALVARRNAFRLIGNLIVGGSGLIVAAGTAACIIGALEAGSPSDRGGLTALAVVLGGIAATCLGFTLANSLLGPCCTTHVQTPHGVEKLSLPRRLSSFHKVLARVGPLIEAAQAQQAAHAPELPSAAPGAAV